MTKTKSQRCFPYLLILCVGLFLIFLSKQTQSLPQNIFHLISLEDDSINPVTAEYITDAITYAESDNAKALIIELDTPGGLLSSTRLIVKRMLRAKVPIIVYIAPNGSRAGSAGVFITYASHIAAMAPSTNIGAAHPVQLGGGKAPKGRGDWSELKELIDELKNQRQGLKEDVEHLEEEENSETKNISDDKEDETFIEDENPMASKILNDTVAFIKSIANERNRNVEWAVQSVTKSDSITADEAHEKGVIEILAANRNDLLEQLDGYQLKVNGELITLETKYAEIKESKMDMRQQFFNILASPNIAYFLMIFGFYGLLYEITHPGVGVPGILGSIFLILAFYSMQTLPTNYAGLSLMVLGLVLLVSEAFIPGFGLLTLGGLVCLVLGSMLLFESVDPIMRVSQSAIFSVVVISGCVAFYFLRIFVKFRKLKVQTGEAGIVGKKGEALTQFSASQYGKVFVHGTIWNAIADDGDIKKGMAVVVKSIEGLNLTISKIDSQNKEK